MMQSEQYIEEVEGAHEAVPVEESEGAGAERRIKGIGIAPGIAIGPVYLYARESSDQVERRQIAPEDVEEEVKRFERAVSRAEQDLGKITAIAREKLGEESADIFEAQLMMLRDEAVYASVRDRIRKKQSSADYAVKAVMTKHRRRMEASDSEYLRERSDDFLDVQERIIRHLRRGKIITTVDPHSIVVAENLNATDIIIFSRRSFLGCAMDYGGATSHVSIMARSLGVPAVVGMHGITDEVSNGDTIILDGLDGQVIINPAPDTLEEYHTRRERHERLLQERKQLVPLPAETLDKHRVPLRANLEFEEELNLLSEYGASGIGLFRTEIPFLMQRRISMAEEEQFDAYQRIVKKVAPEVTTFRVLDVGGDKLLPMGRREHNPMLGWRGLRILLDRRELLVPQLRAILKAGAHGPIRLLVPMVTNLSEVHRFREILSEVREDLDQEGVPHAGDDMPVGIMVEVPAVALMADRFAAEVDFFSIGTNDLTQYVLAVDRGNDLVADTYDEFHPAVLATIYRIIQAGRCHGIPVSLCGEMASNPRALPLLVGLGITELSASPTYLPELKRILRAIKRSEAETLAQQAMDASGVEEVYTLLDDWLDTHTYDLAIHPAQRDGQPST